MLATLSLALLAAAQPPEPGRDWRGVGESNAGSRMAYDRASIRLDRATMVATFFYRLVGERSYRVARVEVRCTEWTARVMRTMRYTLAGALIGSDDIPSGWEAIPPESSFGPVADEACGAAPRPS
jgi:hypothetical protein